MKRLGRWLFKGLVAVSSLCLVATLVLWVRSYWIFDSVIQDAPWLVTPPIKQIPGDSQSLRRTRMGIESCSSQLVLAIRQSVAVRRVGAFTSASVNSELLWTHCPIDASPRLTAQQLTSHAGIVVGFTLEYDHSTMEGERVYAYGASYWLIAVITGVLPAVYFRSLLHRSKRNPGFCRTCGYDLRATPDRCPECGMGVGQNVTKNDET